MKENTADTSDRHRVRVVTVKLKGITPFADPVGSVWDFALNGKQVQKSCGFLDLCVPSLHFQCRVVPRNFLLVRTALGFSMRYR